VNDDDASQLSPERILGRSSSVDGILPRVVVILSVELSRLATVAASNRHPHPNSAMLLLQALLNLLTAILEVVVAVGGIIVPWLPLIAWAAFWALAVNWQRLAAVIRSGAFVGIAMIALVSVLVWGCVAPPIDGHHYFELLGVRLSVSNFTGKLVYVMGLVVIMFAAGSAQLSGMFDGLVCFADEEESEDDHGHDDGHGEHDGHH